MLPLSPPLRILTLGFRGAGSQIDRIEQGFKKLGHEIVTDPSQASLIYCNDSGTYAQAIAAKQLAAPTAKLVMNVLDLCPHCAPSLPLDPLRAQLAYAHAVTCISETVQQDIVARLGIKPIVIYNPIRDVGFNRPLDPAIKHPYRALFVGRVSDPSKRSILAASALAILGYEWDDIITVGRESPPYGGIYYGEATDQILSELYNSVDYLMCPTQHAFLGLPILEAMACGTVPVICNDLDIREEFVPSRLFPEYDAIEPNAPSIARFVAQHQDARQQLADRLHHHYLNQWIDRLSPMGVAGAILSVYEATCSL